MKDIYTGEAQFMAWGDGPTGPWIKLRLPDSDNLEQFRGMTKSKDGIAGQILAVKIVEVELVEPPAEAAHRKQGPLEVLSIRWCKSNTFREWVETVDKIKATITEEDAREYILKTCGCGHRRDLDSIPACAQRFHSMIRDPYMAWLESKA